MAGPRKPAFALERSLTYRLHRLGKLTDKATHAAHVEGTGMGHAEGRCLAAIGAFAPLSVNDFAQAANLNKGQASRAVQSLVDQGLVRKEASATDGRGVVLTLTPAGARMWQRILAIVERRNVEIMSVLEPHERRQLDALLDRLIDGAHGLAGKVPDSDSEAP